MSCPLHILLVGKTGIGKTTLLNQLTKNNLKTSDDLPCTKEFKSIEFQKIFFIDGPGMERYKENQYFEEIKKASSDYPIHLFWYFIDKKGIDEKMISFFKEIGMNYLIIISKSDILTENSIENIGLKKLQEDPLMIGYRIVSPLSETIPIFCNICEKETIEDDQCKNCKKKFKVKETFGADDILEISQKKKSWKWNIIQMIMSKVEKSVNILLNYVSDNQNYHSLQLAYLAMDLTELWVHDQYVLQKRQEIIQSLVKPELLDFFVYVYHGMLGGKTYSTIKYGSIFILTCVLCYWRLTQAYLVKKERLDLKLDQIYNGNVTEQVWMIYERVKKGIRSITTLKKIDQAKMKQELFSYINSIILEETKIKE